MVPHCVVPLLLFVLLSVRGDEPAGSSRIQIHIPRSLGSKQYSFDHRDALFGNHPPGGAIIQQLYYADSDLCGPSQPAVVPAYPRREIDPATNKMLPVASPFLLMVDGGGCTYVTKVRRAQHAGAAGVIIADNFCLCGVDPDVCTPADGWRDRCEEDEAGLRPGGSWQDVTIPSFRMFKQDVDPIKEALKNDTYVQMEMSWSLPQREVVDFSFWSLPGDRRMMLLEIDFSDVMYSLADTTRFTPHFPIFACGDDKTQCASMCTNGGRYCAADPDGVITRGASGADIVEESLRRICIWKLYGEEGEGGGVVWWSYLRRMLDGCSSYSFFSEGCHLQAMQNAKIDTQQVAKCMEDSGGLKNDVANVWLDEEMRAEKEAGVVVSPVVVVNGKPIQGALTFDGVFGAICAGFYYNSEPEACRRCSSCSKGAWDCLLTEYCDPSEFYSAFSWDDDAFWDDDWFSSVGEMAYLPYILTLVSAVVVCVLLGLPLYYYHKRSRRQVRDQVRGILTEYMQVDSLNVDASSASASQSESASAGAYTPATYIPLDYEKLEETNSSS